MSNIKVTAGETSDKVVRYAENVWISYNNGEQGEFIIPEIELFPLIYGVKVAGEKIGETHMYCPNVRVLEHKNNLWSKDPDKENVIICSECGCRMDISSANGIAKIEEVK